MNCRSTSRLLREALKVRRWLDTCIDAKAEKPAVALLVIQWSKLTRTAIKEQL